MGKTFTFIHWSLLKCIGKWLLTVSTDVALRFFLNLRTFPRSVSFRQIITQLRSSGGTFVTQSAQCPLSPPPNSISFVTTFFFLSQVIKRPRTNHRPGAEVIDQSGICGIQHSRWGHMTIKKIKDFYMNYFIDLRNSKKADHNNN